MKNKRIVLLILILVSMVTISSPVFAGNTDKYGDWIYPDPYEGVCFRYVWSYLGQNQWSSYHDLVQFWNATLYKVEITYYVTISEEEDGPFVIDLDPSNAKNPGTKVAIAENEIVSSITVKRPQ